jgi:nucleotide-binding universal stress UspA family protein
MSTISDTTSVLFDASVVPPLFAQPVLVAVDGDESSDAPLAVAAALQRERGARPELLSVIRGFPHPVPTVAARAAGGWDGVTRVAPRDIREAAVRARLAAQVGVDASWPVRIVDGASVDEIVAAIHRSGTHLVVTGLRPHGRLNRVLRRETTVRLIRRAGIPVLAVTPALRGLPRRAVVGLDFGRGSVRAARIALQLLADDATLVLAHAALNLYFGATEEGEGRRFLQTEGVAGALARVRHELSGLANVRIETVALDGDAAGELLALADRCGAELLAVGSHRHPPIDRLLLGSVTTTILRAARCSVLVAPPSSFAAEAPASR